MVFLAVASPHGWAETIKLATWNIEWLTLRHAGDPALPADVAYTRDPSDLARLRSYAEALKADVVGFEEVDGAEVAARVFAPDRYVLHLTGDHVVQRTGLAVRKGLAFVANPDLQALNVYPPEAPFPLRSGADITLMLGANRLRVLAIHLKTGCFEDVLARSHRPACKILAEQLPVLQGWMAARRQEGMPFVVMGDFNRRMEGSDPFLAALNQVTPLARATEGHADPCWGATGRFIDHILAGGHAAAWMQRETLRVLVYRETDNALKEHLSDHCPVSVQFKLP